MIITRTPYRISLAGGGTDRREFYRHEPGQVLSTTVNLYLYVCVRRQLGVVEHPIRLNYSRVEFCDKIDEIEHPLIREALRLYDFDIPIEITTFADLPAYTGMGSSSAFAVGLVHALYEMMNWPVTKLALAQQAAHLEMDVLNRGVGKQDHWASAYGGFNLYTFHRDETVEVKSGGTNPQLQERLMLFYTGIKRDAAESLSSQNGDIGVLRQMKAQADAMRRALAANDLHHVGQLLDQGWTLKKRLGKGVSTPQIDAWYDAAREAGAVGGKLCGAGGGGFLLFYCEPDRQAAVEKALPLFRVPFSFEREGSRVIYREGT